ncbi:ISL3 family transposase [Streptacidiphilus sp. EB103A]|uniref:ISL3 family transposase n=1 Tax=Streptacidiphilus sp. EB103A TaxID=3156275 RepID=UPI003512114F
MQVEEVMAGSGLVRITARTRDGVAVLCPGCGRSSDWEHSRYVRHLADEAVGGRAVVIDLSVRRLYCENPACPKATFVEQAPGLSVRYQRRTPALQRVLDAVAVALAGRAGARLLVHLHQAVSWATMLHCLMSLPDPPAPTPTVLGVDDFALRKGQHYGTLLVDTLSRLPIDLWTGRAGEPLTHWLKSHPGVQVVCRDGSLEYRAAITAGAPGAVQVSDRFHLWQGLARRVYEEVCAHRACLARPPDPPPAPPQPAAPDAMPAPPPAPPGRAARRARTTFTAVHALLDQGLSGRAVARQLGIGKATVARYASAGRWQDKVPVWPTRTPGLAAAHRDYLLQRWDQGQHQAAVLHREITGRGFQGSYATVRNFLSPLRAALHGPHRTPPAPGPVPPSAREATGWITRRPENLTQDQQTQLKQVLDRSPELTEVCAHVRSFATMLTSGTDTGLDEWIQAVRASLLPALPGFARGLASDLDAVRAGLTLPYNSGVNEGRVTDLKLIKRQMAGRASIPLLRKRVILAAHSRRTTTTHPTNNDPWTITSYENLV